MTHAPPKAVVPFHCTTSYMTLPPAVQHVSASRTAAAAGKRALEDTRRPLKERLGLEEIIIGTNAQPAIVYAADLFCKGAAPTFFFFFRCRR
ncbi:hypothetical protein PoMZ_12706 [Pyricularia oryzae]|uniref:Uncharacterized protein n=1 Tax=Pyricularia oryzae TaxID=318829 RepID=A0A4P7NTI2_PYROR|nr:hypothetical protein PoMZ_12706 [Pyricularia oryzae]